MESIQLKSKPTKVGDRFEFQGRTYTARSFFGKTKVEYPTLQEATDSNPDDIGIGVLNQEYGGCCLVKECRLIQYV